MRTSLHRPDFPLIPVSIIPATPKDTPVIILDNTNVSDWSTLHLQVVPQLTSQLIAAVNTSAVTIILEFEEADVTSGQPNSAVMTGRTLCVGAIALDATNIRASRLNIRVPIPSSLVNIQAYFPSSQTNVTGIRIACWTSNDPTYGAPVIGPIGDLYNLTGYSGDSLLGNQNAGVGVTRGVIVPASSMRIVEFAEQTIGKATFHFAATALTGAAITGAEIATWVCSKSYNDATGTFIDEVQWSFATINPATGGIVGSVENQAQGIPLNAFRQGVGMSNNTAGGTARSVAWNWTIYPEFI